MSGGEAVPGQAGHIDEQRLSHWLAENVEGFSGPLALHKFPGGQSNPTFSLETPARRYVLRRKPPGPTLKGAHAVDREVRVQSALASAGFPVPRVHALCTDDQVIGSWFYVMEQVEGRIFWDATFPEVSAAERPAYFDAMNATLANLHRIEPAAVGLEDYGRPGNYFQRQISRWARQYFDDENAGRDANMDRVIDWLQANIPENEDCAIIHGDFRCDNMIFHPSRPEVIAVLDWELSTLGDPLADFAYHTTMYHMPPDIVAGLHGADLSALNIPGEMDYIESYCRRTGRDGIPDYPFYLVFNFFRLAAIFHGIRGRVLRGTASSKQARERGEKFPVLAAIAADLADACA